MKLMSERLQYIRLKNNLNQKEFSKKIGIPPTTYRGYEISSSIPNAEVLARICKQFNVNPSWLLLGEGSPFGETKQTPEYSPYEIILSDILHRIGYYETDFTPEQLENMLSIVEKDVKSALWDTQAKIFSLIRSWKK